MVVKGHRTIEFMIIMVVVSVLLFGVASLLSLTGGDVNHDIGSVTVENSDDVVIEGLPGISNDLGGEVISWWVFEGISGFRVLNQTQKTSQISLKLTYGLNPCGSDITYEQTFKKSKEVFRLNSKRTSLDSNLSFVLEPLEFVTISVTTNGENCLIPSDPRTFLGQISTKLKSAMPSEFSFAS